VSDAALGDLDAHTRERLAELPPTASLVYLELRTSSEPQTLEQLTQRMSRPKTSVHRALKQLCEVKLVTRSPRHAEPRQTEWIVIDQS